MQKLLQTKPEELQQQAGSDATCPVEADATRGWGKHRGGQGSLMAEQPLGVDGTAEPGGRAHRTSTGREGAKPAATGQGRAPASKYEGSRRPNVGQTTSTHQKYTCRGSAKLFLERLDSEHWATGAASEGAGMSSTELALRSRRHLSPCIWRRARVLT